jgi:hypothetical protein
VLAAGKGENDAIDAPKFSEWESLVVQQSRDISLSRSAKRDERQSADDSELFISADKRLHLPKLGRAFAEPTANSGLILVIAVHVEQP